MWKHYLTVVADRARQAVQVLDRFHIMIHFSKAIDESPRGGGPEMGRCGQGAYSSHERWLT